MKKKPIALYLLICFLFSWALMFSLYLLPEGMQSMGMSMIGIPSMMMPFLTVLLVKKCILKEKTGISWKLHLKGHVGTYLLAMYLPVGMTLLAAGLYFLFFPGQLDLSLQGTIAMMPPEALEAAGGAEKLRMGLFAQLPMAALLGWLVNVPMTLGEEGGWRGFLYPELEKKYGVRKSLIFGGIIWGLWHLPLTIQGHNYGLHYWGFPLVGIAMMCLFSITAGILLAWLTKKTDSIWPAVFCHSAINAFGPAFYYMIAPQYMEGGWKLLGPGVSGIIGMLPLMVLAFFALRNLSKEN